MKKITTAILTCFIINFFICNSSMCMMPYKPLDPNKYISIPIPKIETDGSSSASIKNKILEKMKNIRTMGANLYNVMEKSCCLCNDINNGNDVLTILWNVINDPLNNECTSWILGINGLGSKENQTEDKKIKIFKVDPTQIDFWPTGKLEKHKEKLVLAFRQVESGIIVYTISIPSYKIIINLYDDGKGEICNAVYVAPDREPINLIDRPCKFDLSPQETDWVKNLIKEAK